MEKEKVALLKCDEYDDKIIEEKIRQGFKLLGGEEFIKKLIPYNSSVLLKPNMLCVEKTGALAVTNNKFFEAVIRVLKDYTTKLSFGDSPAFEDSRRAAEKSGLMEVASKYGVKFESFNETVHVKLEESILCKSWTVAKAPYEADVVITLPRLKTHAMAFLTGAIKNQFGCIHGTTKATWHTRMPDANNFCKMLLDLNSVVGTKFAIMDGIVAMQGNGPKNGTPYNLKTIIMGESLAAVDSTAARIIGYDNPLEIPALKEAYDSKWGEVLQENILVLGENIENMKVSDFRLCRKGGNFYFINTNVTNFLRGLIAPNPSVIQNKCIGCSRCYEICPEKPNVIKMVKKDGKIIPVWNMKKCIRCFCCQELCPAGAIKTKYPVVGKLMNKR